MSNYDVLDYREDHCCECRGLGDDYSYDDEGDLISNCSDCPYNSVNDEG